MLAEWAGAPLVTPYVVFLVLLALAFIGIALTPETATRPEKRPVYRPQRVSVPQHARGRFFLAGGIAFSAFSVLGLFTSLAPSFVAGQLHITSRAIAGLVVFVTFTAATLSQIAVRPLTLAARIALGATLLVLGIAILAVVVETVGALGWFFLGGIVSGAGADHSSPPRSPWPGPVRTRPPGRSSRRHLPDRLHRPDPAGRGHRRRDPVDQPGLGHGRFAVVIIAITLFTAIPLLTALRRASR